MNRLAYYLLFLITTLALQNSRGADFRIFHDSTGRAIEASLRSYDPRTKTVKVELKNRSVRSVNLSIFSESDQNFIREWHMANAMLSESKIRLSVNKRTVKSEEIFRCAGGWNGLDPGLRCKEIEYDIKVENRSGVPLNNLRMEYCIYKESTIDETTRQIEYREEYQGTVTLSRKKHPRKVEIAKVSGSFKIPNLPNKEKFSTKAKHITLLNGRRGKRNKELTIGTDQDIDDDLQGIRIRLYVPMKSGNEVMKEYAYPSDLLKKEQLEWSTPVTDSPDDVNADNAS